MLCNRAVKQQLSCDEISGLKLEPTPKSLKTSKPFSPKPCNPTAHPSSLRALPQCAAPCRGFDGVLREDDGIAELGALLRLRALRGLAWRLGL